jgi:hypothetical protein
LENLENAENQKTESDELVRTAKGGIELTEDEWKVEEIFKESAQQELEQPRLESGTWGASLSVPIIHSGTHVGLEMCFFLHLTD